jgi:hypothetical protein
MVNIYIMNAFHHYRAEVSRVHDDNDDSGGWKTSEFLHDELVLAGLQLRRGGDALSDTYVVLPSSGH